VCADAHTPLYILLLKISNFCDLIGILKNEEHAMPLNDEAIYDAISDNDYDKAQELLLKRLGDTSEENELEVFRHVIPELNEDSEIEYNFVKPIIDKMKELGGPFYITSMITGFCYWFEKYLSPSENIALREHVISKCENDAELTYHKKEYAEYLFRSDNYKKAWQCCDELIELGHCDGAIIQSLMAREGLGVKKDLFRAFELEMKAMRLPGNHDNFHNAYSDHYLYDVEADDSKNIKFIINAEVLLWYITSTPEGVSFDKYLDIMKKEGG